jgi:hypothetical protein
MQRSQRARDGPGSGTHRGAAPRPRARRAAAPRAAPPQQRPAAAAPRAAAAAPPHEPADAEFGAAYDALASLVTPPGGAAAGALRAGPSPRGRGLLAARPLAAGAPVLSVEAWNALAVSDAPGGRGRGAYGAGALAEWQAVHGPLPPLLASYVASGGCWSGVGWRRRWGVGGVG